MNFIDEHYARVFRMLANQQQRRSVDVSPSSEQHIDETAILSDLQKRLAQKAFNLLMLLPAEGDKNDSEARLSSKNDMQLKESLTTQFQCPPLASVLEDLKLVEDQQKDNVAATSEQADSVDLVMINAVAAIHAHTMQQLLESTLFLSVDIDYWNSQSTGPMSLALYFMQTIPQRLYRWVNHALSTSYSFCHSVSSLNEQIRLLMSRKYLFPAGRIMKKSLTPVNMLALVKYEIRFNQRKLMETKDRLASCIGTLSQVSPEQKESDLLLQIKQVIEMVNSATIDEGKTGKIRCLQAALVRNLSEQISAISKTVSSDMRRYSRPSLITRYWMPAIVMLTGARWLTSYVVGHQEDIKVWISDGLLTMRNYILQYILVPLKSGYETIRYGKHTYSVMSDASLASDVHSLEEMVVGFAKRFGTVNPDSVRTRVAHGDLSDVMQVYAHEMQQPFRNVLFGDLIQAMLIQVQKVKVDVGQTMAALDKLLRSNELNFLLLSTVPATFSIYAAVKWLSARVSWWASGSSRHTVASIRVIVRDIDRLLNTGCKDNEEVQLSSVSQGNLICLTNYLRHHARELPNLPSSGRLSIGSGWVHTLPHTRNMFIQDIRDIETTEFSVTQKQRVVQRMYRTFGFL